MAGVIKGVLREELNNSIRMKKAYERELKKLPPGNISIKKIRGHYYSYRVQREGKRVRFFYIGKTSKKAWEKHSEAKEVRAKYKKLLSQVKKQIRFLKGALRGKEAI
ncbi:hypothetical protein BVX98_05180 [bacterium F11]|nr:hypothetical protein BVX98_05180 [bacterium F11]